MFGNETAGFLGRADRVANGRRVGRGLVGDAGFELARLPVEASSTFCSRMLLSLSLPSAAVTSVRMREVETDMMASASRAFSPSASRSTLPWLSSAMSQLVRLLVDQGREGVGLLVDRAVDLGDLAADGLGGGDGLDRDDLLDGARRRAELFERVAHGHIHAIGRRVDVVRDVGGGGDDALGDGLLDAVGAGFEVGHRLDESGVDGGVERSQALGGDVGAGGDRLGQGAQALVDHVGDGLAGRVDAGLDDVGGRAGAFAHGRGGAVDAGGHAALGIGDAQDRGVDAAAEIVVHLGDLAGDERRDATVGAVGHDLGHVARGSRRSCRGPRCPARRWCGPVPSGAVADGVGNAHGVAAEGIGELLGAGVERFGQFAGPGGDGDGELLGALVEGVAECLGALVEGGVESFGAGRRGAVEFVRPAAERR